MAAKVSKYQPLHYSGARRVFALFGNFFSFTGDLDPKEYGQRIIFVAGVALLSTVWIFVPLLHSLFLLGTIISLSSLIVRRLRSSGYPWTLIFIGLIPVLGWVALSILILLRARLDEHRTVPAGKLVLSAVATFIAIALVFTSLSLQETANSALTNGGSQSATNDLAKLETLIPDEAVAASGTAADEAQASEAETDVEEKRADKVQQAQVDQTFEELVSGLTVEPEFVGGYDRDLFKHWKSSGGNGCDTRKEVLITESLTPVSVQSGCSISGGSWFSSFDGITTTDPSSFDVDHLVPLAEAWRSGAHGWDSATRERFANDLGYEMSLIAVSAGSNRSKGDRDPASWMPPNGGFKCEYVHSWVNVKLRWSLSVDDSELAALKKNWSGCSTSSLNLSPTPSTTMVLPAPTPAPGKGIGASPPTSGATSLPQAASGGCVDINSASFEDLQQILHIGPTRASELISLRPFSSVNDLSRINGISTEGVRLGEIRAQGLACLR